MELEEFKIEVLPFKNKLYRFAKRLLKNTEEAEDVVQEVFIKLWNKRNNLEDYKSIEAFAMIVTKNLCLDKLKSKKNKTVELNSNFTIKNDSTPYSKMVLSDTIDKVNKIIDKLPEQQKIIIQLRDIEGYDFDEIAEIMKLNLNTIRVNLSRARKKVRDTLVKTYNYEH